MNYEFYVGDSSLRISTKTGGYYSCIIFDLESAERLLADLPRLIGELKTNIKRMKTYKIDALNLQKKELEAEIEKLTKELHEQDSQSSSLRAHAVLA